jgi:hemolysin activation/secretion protein
MYPNQTLKNYLIKAVMLFSFGLVFIFPSKAIGQEVIPQSAEPGVIEKSFRESRPEYQRPTIDEKPEITIKDSRTLKDPGAGPAFFVKRIEVKGSTLINKKTLADIVDLDGGMEATLGILTLIANEITALYAKEGYLLAKAFIPQQKIQDGVIKIQVVEGRVGKIKVKGIKRYNSKEILRRMKVVRKEPVLKEQTLERTLLELNDLMGVKVQSTLKAGELPGTSDMVLEVTESRPWKVSYDMDNFGSRFTGRTRFGMNGARGNLFLLGDQLSGRWVRSNFGQDTFSPSYVFPLNYIGTKARLAYTFSEYELKKSLKNNAGGGNSHLFTMEVSHPLERSRTSQTKVRGGFDFKSFEGEQSGNNTTKDNLQELFFGIGGNKADSLKGQSFYDLKMSVGLKEGDSGRGLISRTGGQGDVFTTNINLTRFQSLPYFNSYVIAKFSGQANTQRALSSGQMSIGGMGTVRGFPIGEYAGDMGYVFSGEYVIPFPWNTSSLKNYPFFKSILSILDTPFIKKLPPLKQMFSFNIFFDHGKVFTRNKLSTESDRKISGLGGGFKFNLPKKEGRYPGASIALSYAVPVLGSPAPTDGSSGTLYLSGLISY